MIWPELRLVDSHALPEQRLGLDGSTGLQVQPPERPHRPGRERVLRAEDAAGKFHRPFELGDRHLDLISPVMIPRFLEGFHDPRPARYVLGASDTEDHPVMELKQIN